MQAVVELRDAWDEVEGRMQRDSEEQPGTVLPGLIELQALLGEQVQGVGTLHLAKERSQARLTQACWKAAERKWRKMGDRIDGTRLTDCGGKEAQWVSAVPSRPQYALTSADWRDAFCNRLGVPKSFLEAGPGDCDCHDRFDRRSGQIRMGRPDAQRPRPDGTEPRRRTRKRPKPVDAYGEHDQRCPHSFKLGRHDAVQAVTQRLLQRGGIQTNLASVHELRASSADTSQKKADLQCTNLSSDGKVTLLDLGITHPLIDTNISIKSTEERGFAANKYGDKKEAGYVKVIEDNELDLNYHSFTFGTFGAFGSGTWKVIKTVCDPETHPHAHGDYDPWKAPDPKRDFTLTLGFALQRANARMVRNADLRRRRNRASERYASGAKDHEDLDPDSSDSSDSD